MRTSSPWLFFCHRCAETSPPTLAARNLADDPLFQLGYLNVRHYARGDGVTDDTEALRQALADGLDYGLALYFPPGTYVVSDTLDGVKRQKSYVKGYFLLGDPANRPVIRLQDRARGFGVAVRPGSRGLQRPRRIARAGPSRGRRGARRHRRPPASDRPAPEGVSPPRHLPADGPVAPAPGHDPVWRHLGPVGAVCRRAALAGRALFEIDRCENIVVSTLSVARRGQGNYAVLRSEAPGREGLAFPAAKNVGLFRQGEPAGTLR